MPVAPPRRAEGAIAYDSARGCVVLRRFRHGEGERLGDSCEWDGRQWTLAATTGLSPRNNPAVTYDALRRCGVLFGGSGATHDTWTWNGASWQQL